MTNTSRQLLMARLKIDEGVRLKPYRDTVGKLTIGVGRNLDDVGISWTEAEVLLSNDITAAERDLLVAFPWVEGLDEVRQRVLVNMAFNLGVPRLKGFKRTLRLVQTGQYAEAAVAMLESLWAEQVGARARRLAEAMETGVEK